jgi:hypothetical protein
MLRVEQTQPNARSIAMNVKLIAAAIASLGLAACSPDITPQASTAPAAPVAASAPAQPVAEQQVAKADTPAAAPAAQEEKKDEAAAPAATEAKKEEGAK